ncbi:MAG: hypothetical protein HY736_11325, partial [Verrucomicrobia bacterium]|nr:hypothetical protein [Verrucomicrobiota bacterium]
IQHARDSHHRWHSFLFTSIPRRSWLDRAVWWAACRLSLLSGKISIALLRNRIANYEGDTTCYADRGT